jgi:hypothetical protein
MNTRRAGKPGTFKKGADSRRNMSGAKSRDACELHRLMSRAMAEAGLKDQRFQKLADMIWEKALKGITFYVEKALEYSIGKPIQQVDHSGKVAHTLRFKFGENGEANGNGD